MNICVLLRCSDGRKLHLISKNFLGGACPQTPLASSGRVAALTGDRGGLPGLPKIFSW